MKKWFNRNNKVTYMTRLSMQALQTLYYLAQVLFVFQCGLMIAYLDLIELWHVLVLELLGFIIVIIGNMDFDYSESEDDDDDI